MQATVALTVARYRPEKESEPTFQTYEVPFRKDGVILDALNFVKDRLDGSSPSCGRAGCGRPVSHEERYGPKSLRLNSALSRFRLKFPQPPSEITVLIRGDRSHSACALLSTP